MSLQCGYRETLVPNWDLATKQGQGNILFHDQLTDTESMTSARASDFPFQKKQFSVSKKGEFRFNSVSLLPKLNLMKSQ